MAGIETNVHLVGESVYVDTDSMDEERALLWASLVMDPRFGKSLKDDFVGYDTEAEPDMCQPLSEEDMRVVTDEVALLKLHGKGLDNTGDGCPQYNIPLAQDLALGGAQKVLATAGYNPFSHGQLPYTIVGHDQR